MIRTVQGKKVTYEELLRDLQKDNIVMRQPPKELVAELAKSNNSHLQCDVLANRYKDMYDVTKHNEVTLSDMLTTGFIEEHMPEVKDSTALIVKHIEAGNKIVFVTDFDVDGITSGVIAHKLMHNLFSYSNIEVVVNKRKHGNGINDILTKTILRMHEEDHMGLMITSDHGSHDRVNIKRIKDTTGMDIIVTDHHLFNDDTWPIDADAFVNPQRRDNDFKYITGSNVIYFVLIHAYMTMNSHIPAYDRTYMFYVLTYVGMTIISDCMDLKSYINRKIVVKLLTDLNSVNTKHDTFWDFMINEVKTSYVVDESTLGYNVIPLLNTPGRIDDPRLSFELMTTTDKHMLIHLYRDIQALNVKRKSMQSKAVESKDKEEYHDGIVKVMLLNNSEGVQGIIANNVIYNDNYKVAICFTKHGDGKDAVYVGSGRSQDENLNLKELVDGVAAKSGMVIKHGGHKSAIGVKMKPDLKKFYKYLQEEISTHNVTKITKHFIEGYIYSVKKLMLNIFDLLELSPYGIGFERPLFASDVYIDSYRIFSKSSHFLNMKVKLDQRSSTTIGVFYNIKNSDIEEFRTKLQTCRYVRLVYTIDINSYRNENKILLSPVEVKFKC